MITWSDFDTDDQLARRRMMDFADKMKKCRYEYSFPPEGKYFLSTLYEINFSNSEFEQYVFDTYGIEYIMGDDAGTYGQRGIVDFKIVDEQKFLLFNLKYT